MAKGNEKGFTLIDVVVVMAVIAILVAVFSPYITRYIDESKIAKARNETQGIGGALTNFNKDVGQWPTKNPADGAGVINVHYTGILPPNHAAYPDLINGKTGWGGPYAAIATASFRTVLPAPCTPSPLPTSHGRGPTPPVLSPRIHGEGRT
jgi:prepilin-type N-terminal cleavage/methylation domain-containing protein